MSALRRLRAGVLLGTILAAFPARASALTKTGTIDVAVTVVDIWPPRPVADFQLVPGYEGQTFLSFTAPYSDVARVPRAGPVSAYIMRQATFTAAALGGNTTAWWNAASAVPGLPGPLLPGTTQGLTLTQLTPGVTFTFALRSVDQAANLSDFDSAFASGTPRQVYFQPIPPATPSNFGAVVQPDKSVRIVWDELTLPQKGADFTAYNVYRSTLPASGFGLLVSTPVAGATDATAVVGATYYYFLTALDAQGLASPPTPVVRQGVSPEPPLPPADVKVATAAASVNVSWSPVTHYLDGVPFANPAAPAVDELTRYLVYRSTSIAAPNWVLRGSVPFSSTSLIDPWDGSAYYYQVRAAHILSTSPVSMSVGVDGVLRALAPDQVSYIEFTPAAAAELTAAKSGQGDLIIVSTTNPAEIGGTIFGASEFMAQRTDGTFLPQFEFQGLVRVVLVYQVSGGLVVPSAPVPQAVTSLPAPQAASGLGIFWNNGSRWVKLYGKVDTLSRTVSVDTHAVGPYQLRVMERLQGATFDPRGGLSGRVITPNGDGLNDVLIWQLDNPAQSDMEGRIFDLRGARVADLVPGPRTDTLQWDGKAGGQAVPSGVYIYQIQIEDKIFNGSIVVAR